MSANDSLVLGGGGVITVGELKQLLGITAGSYTVYRALLNEEDGEAPVATVLENSLGVTPTYTYNGEGVYRMTATGIFADMSKLYLNCNQFTGEGMVNSVFIFFTRINDNTLEITVTGGDGQLVNTGIEIYNYS